MINERRLQEYFLDLVQIDSEAGEEREIADRLQKDLEALGASVIEDDAGQVMGSNAGNLIATIPGNVAGVAPMLLCSHMDTVVPGKGVRPVIDGRIIHSDGRTILGSDDKSGIALIMEVLRTAREQRIALGDLEVVFTIKEEKGLLGAKALNPDRLRSRFGLVFDSDEPGVLFTRAPAANHLEFHIFGQAAHAGVAPERGLNAIKIAGEALAAMRLGRIDDETTANIGVIHGGAATNIVAPEVELHGEARSRNMEKLEEQTRHMIRCFEEAAARYRIDADGKTIQARAEAMVERAYEAMDLSDDAAIVSLVRRAAANLHQTVPTRAMGGACDANIFNGRGISVANLGTGMRDIHTKNEWINMDELAATTRLVLEVVQLHASA